MVYTKTSSREIIGRILNGYKIDTTEWIPKSPVWIVDAMANMKIYAELEDRSETITVEDSRFMLPCDIKSLVHLSYNGFPVHSSKDRKVNDRDTSKVVQSDYYSYELLRDRHVLVNFVDGDIIVDYQSAPFEYDNELAVYFPIIPDDTLLKIAIEEYILMRVIQRGYKVMGKDLTSNNYLTNPGLGFEKKRKRARASVASFDLNKRKQISRVLSSFLIDIDPDNFN